VHLFINGLYWGIYRIGERVDDVWVSDHFGGTETDWDVIAPDTTVAASLQAKAGNITAWNNLFNLVNAPDLTVPANYEAVAAQMDLVNFVDFYLLHIHADSEDWPHHNGYAIRNRVVPSSKWQFVPWDQEIAFDPLVLVDRYSPGAPNTAGNANAQLTFGVLYQKLRASAEFRLLFADRAHKHLHNGGALSLAVEQARWQGFADLLDKAIVAESARWGDTADATPYGTAVLPADATLKRETHWLPQVNTVKNSHLPALHNTANSFATITELKSQSLYPNTEPPVFNQFGGNVVVNFSLSITAPAGSIYYTTNGNDPREAYTGNPVGTLYSGPISLTQTCTVKARSRVGTVWSALTEATFIVGNVATSANLAVTELNYNPVNSDHEFIELTNFSGTTIDLTDVHFEGITFTFADGTLLSAGERIVVVRNQAAFVAQYGNGPRVAGEYTGALDNTGEEIAVIAANGLDILRFTYNDKAPWPKAADGGGRSLVLRDPAADPVNEQNWRVSSANGGNPGGSDSTAFSGTALADEDKDGFQALIEYLFGTSDTVPNPEDAPFAAIEDFEVAAVTSPYLTFTALAQPGADAANVTVELSTNFSTWDGTSTAVVYVGETVAGDGTVTRKWRAAQPYTGAVKQHFRIRAQLP
jgi:hypothetical protein